MRRLSWQAFEEKWGELVRAAAGRHALDPAVLAGLIMAESGGNPSARSGPGALGLTQVMPATARCYGYDLTTPAGQIDAGADYLARCLRHRACGGRIDLALAAYNAGWGNVSKYGGMPPFKETRAYVPRVLKYAEEYRRYLARTAPPEPPKPMTPTFLPAEDGPARRGLRESLLYYWRKARGRK